MTTTEHWKRDGVKRHFRDVVRAPSLQIFTAQLDENDLVLELTLP